MLQATPEEIIGWLPPSQEVWQSFPGGSEEPDLDEIEFHWLAERLSRTYLSEWSDDALRFEYRVVTDGHMPTKVPVELAYERAETVESINAELARRRVHGEKFDEEAIDALMSRALEAIHDGERLLASNLFQAARALNPNDLLMANNQAFCLIPDSPRAALAMLDEIADAGLESVLVQANRAACFLTLGDVESSLAACESARSVGLASGSRGWMWELPDIGSAQLVFMGSGEYTARLALHSAQLLSDSTALDEWDALLRALVDGD